MCGHSWLSVWSEGEGQSASFFPTKFLVFISIVPHSSYLSKFQSRTSVSPPKSLCPGSRQRTSRCKTQENLGLWTILLPLTSHFTLIQTLGVTLIQLSAWEECPLHLESSHPHVCSLQKKKEKKNFPGLPHAQINGKIGCLPPNLQDL